MRNFLSDILPPLTPNVVGGIPFGSKGCWYTLGLRGNSRVQQAHETINSIVEHASNLVYQGFDAYMATAGYASPFLGRKASNTESMKCFWADLDVGKQNTPYRTQAEAAVALADFAGKTGLKPTWVVSSGLGLHVYWVLNKSIPATAWKAISVVFKNFMQQNGLVADPARTCDAASVLRIPGTIHQKSKSVVTVLVHTDKVWTPESFIDVVASASDIHIPVAQKLPTPLPQVKNQKLMQQMGMGPAPKKPSARGVVAHCKQIMTMGGGLYPQWYGAMTVLRRCEDGLEWTHKLSALDTTRYDYSKCEEKFYQAPEDAPCTCATFESYEPKWCNACKFRGIVKSPLQLHNIEVPQPVKETKNSDNIIAPEVAPAAPNPSRLVFPDKTHYQRVPITHPSFKVDDRGIVWIHREATVDDTGLSTYVEKEDVITRSRLYFKYSIWEELEKGRPARSYMFEVVHPGGKTYDVLFRVSVDMTSTTIMRWFNNANIYPVSSQYGAKQFMAFMNAYLSTVVHKERELETAQRFGWYDYLNTKTQSRERGFVVGQGLITEHGFEDVALGEEAQHIGAKEFTRKGTLDAWKYVPQMYKVLKQEVGQLAVCMSFAAPLMRWGLGEATSATFSLWSAKSGMGKSQVLRTAASVWGDPMQSFVDRASSTVARTRKLSTLQNLPMFLDELTSLKPEDMYGLAYTLVSGKEKTKLKSGGGGFVDTGEWATVTMTTANTSFKAAVGQHTGDSDASIVRVMEYETDFPSYESRPDVQSYIHNCMATCRENYGLAGPEFIYQLLQRTDRIAALPQYVEGWHRNHQFAAKERFMSAPLALALQAGRWAVEFGLLDYDMDALERWVLKVFVPHNRHESSECAPDFKDLLCSYLTQQLPSTLVVTYSKRPGNCPDPFVRGLPDKYVWFAPTQAITARVEVKSKVVMFSQRAFHVWCKNQNISPQVLLRDIAAYGATVNIKTTNLGKGVSYINIPATKCYIMEGAALDAIGYSFPVRKDMEDSND